MGNGSAEGDKTAAHNAKREHTTRATDYFFFLFIKEGINEINRYIGPIRFVLTNVHRACLPGFIKISPEKS